MSYELWVVGCGFGIRIGGAGDFGQSQVSQVPLQFWVLSYMYWVEINYVLMVSC